MLQHEHNPEIAKSPGNTLAYTVKGASSLLTAKIIISALLFLSPYRFQHHHVELCTKTCNVNVYS